MFRVALKLRINTTVIPMAQRRSDGACDNMTFLLVSAAMVCYFVRIDQIGCGRELCRISAGSGANPGSIALKCFPCRSGTIGADGALILTGQSFQTGTA